jgi:formylglycine-generating enzyme required for sulfatase activity
MRLPTEAEWEYAARAGSPNERHSEIGDIAAYGGNSEGTRKVGSKWPNQWGLYDMLGNVFEWTNDWYEEDYYKTSPIDDPRGPRDGAGKVVRGGSWYYNPQFVRVSYRGNNGPAYRNYDLGFRCAENTEPRPSG